MTGRAESARRRPLSVAVKLLAALAAGLVLAELAFTALDLPRTERSFRFVQANREVGELFAAGMGVFVHDPEIEWKLDPASQLYVCNELGLRGWLPRGPKREGDLRIACVGDSCTFGFGVRYEETYGVRLERELQAEMPGRRVESVLAAVVGHSTWQNVVLYRRHIAPLRPDLTVLYCGAWNDQAPCIGSSDRERHRRRQSFRLWRFAHLLLGGDPALTAEAEDAIRRGEAPFGRRVAIEEFEANLTTMVEAARGVGSAVVLIVPPLPASTEAKHPESLRYRASVRRVARELGAPVVDAPAVFERHGGAALFHDWVHPTSQGHELLARELHAQVRGTLGPAAPSAQPSGTRPVLRSCTPAAAPALSEGWLTLAGEGFAAPGALDRVWIGDRWADETRVLDDRRLEVRLPVLRPGLHEIELVTAGGALRGGVRLRVDPPESPVVEAGLEAGPPGVVRVSFASPWKTYGSMWASTGRRERALATQHGPFWLLDAAVADEQLMAGELVHLARLKLRRVDALLPRAGRFGAVFELDEELLRGRPRELHLQGLVWDLYDPSLATVTRPAAVSLPERPR